MLKRWIATVLLLTAVGSAAEELPRLATGARLDPAAPTHPLGNFPLAMALSPSKRHVAVLLCGWQHQGIQIVDRANGAVTQTIEQPAAFVGLAFSPDGKWLAASGGNDDVIVLYAWRDGEAVLDRRIALNALHEKQSFYPAGLAFSSDGKRLYVAENLSDTLAVVDVERNEVLQRVRCGRYPYGVAVSKQGDVYVTAWGDDTVARFATRQDGALVRRPMIAAGRHPSALLLDELRHRLYAASATTDSIAVIDTLHHRILRTLHDDPPGATREGSTPNALALSADGRLFVAEADNNAVAVFAPDGKLAGRIPTDWYPSALAVDGSQLFVVAAKGRGSRPNPQLRQPGVPGKGRDPEYTLAQLDGSLMAVGIDKLALEPLSRRVAAANGWNAPAQHRKYPPFKHVLYCIKENRAYDQVLGDLGEGDGDPSLVYFPRAVSPNHHALAERFGDFDRFFVNAEVSADGHNWSTAAYATDYLEKTVASEYSSRGRTYDYEGSNRDVIVDDDDDAAAPSTGYLWDAAVRKGISLRNYGEFVLDDQKTKVRRATRRALVANTNLDYPGFDLTIPDQQRVDVWLADFKQWVARGDMPALQILRLPNDHTSGGSAGKPTPRAYMADNDLALGRIVEALSHSPFWKDSVLFVVEDDAQNGPDHVDSHRAPFLLISPYDRPGVIHRFANTTDVLATIEEILGLQPMSQFDRFGRPLDGIFAAEPDPTPYNAIEPSVDREERNPPKGPEAKASAALDFHDADRADEQTFNAILWRMLKGDTPMPPPRRMPAGALVESR